MILRRFMKHVKDQNWFTLTAPVIPDAGLSEANASFDPGSICGFNAACACQNISDRFMPALGSLWITRSSRVMTNFGSPVQ